MKVAKFELPRKNEITVKPDVQPRKDFTDAKNLVQNYLDLRKIVETRKDISKNSIDFTKLLKNSKRNKFTEATTEMYLNSVEEKVLNYNYYINNKEPKSIKPMNDIFGGLPSDTKSKENSNDNIMNLLDKLEQEVKHIELDKNKKELLDAKIRKIYGSIVGRPGLPPKMNEESDHTDLEFSDHDKIVSDRNRFSDIEDNDLAKKEQYQIINGFESVNYRNDITGDQDKQPDSLNEIRPVSRSQNALIDQFNENHHRDVRNYKNTKDYDNEIKRPYIDNQSIKKRTYLHHSETDIDERKIKTTNDDRETLRTRHIYSDTEAKKRIKDAEKRKHIHNDHEGDPLSTDRRKYYQAKLDTLERKLLSTRRLHHNDVSFDIFN